MAVQFILFNFANYSPSIAMELKVSKEITCKWQNQRSETNKYVSWALLLGCPFQGCPIINSVFGRLCRKTVPWGREDKRVWYRETIFSQMVSYDFPLHGPLHEYFCTSSPPPQKPRRRCGPEEGYLRCSIIFSLFEFKSVSFHRETRRNAHVAYKPTRGSRKVHTKRLLWASGLGLRGRFVNSKRELSIDVVHEQ